MKRGDLQKYLSKTNILTSAAALTGVVIAGHWATRDEMSGTRMLDENGNPIEICITDDFQEACAETLEGAQWKFQTDPQPISRTAGNPFNDAATENKSRYTVTVGIPEFHTHRYAGIRYDVPDEFRRALSSATRGDPINATVMTQVLGSESGFKNQSSHTGAFSVGQFTMSTFLETVFQHKAKLSDRQRGIVENNIQQYDASGDGDLPIWRYRIKDDGSANAVRNLAKNAAVVTVLVREHMRTATKDGESRFRDAIKTRIDFMRSDKYDGPRDFGYDTRLKLLEFNLNRPMTSADVKTFYLCGARGGAELLAAVADPRNHHMRASDFTTENVVNSNPGVFTTPDGSPRSVYDYYGYIVHRVGNHPLPRDLDRPAASSRNSKPLSL